MKQNTFYVLAGVVGLVVVLIFWLSLESRTPFLVTAIFIIGIAILYGAGGRVTDRRQDERSALITQKASLRTFQVFWVVFFAISLGGAVIGLGAPGFPRPPPRPPNEGLIPLGNLGIVQMALLIAMIFLYVGFRMYYARRYGDWERDEEQD